MRVYQDEVTLPDDFMRLAGNQVRVANRTLDMLGRVEFRHRFAGKHDINKPQYATLIDTNDALSGIDNRKLRLFPIPSSVERGFLTYVTKDLVTAADGEWKEEFDLDTDEPIVPRRYRHAIFLHALSNWYRDRKDDTRSQEVFAQYQQIMSRIINDTEAGQSNMRIRPGLRSYRRKAGRPYRRGGRSSKYDFWQI